MILYREDQTKFINWLDSQVNDNKLLIEQMKKINAPAVMSKQREIETAAFEIVSNILKNTEYTSIK